MISDDLIRQLSEARVIAVTTFMNSSNAVPTARALLAGGVSAIELTLRTPAALDALRLISTEVPEMLICAGTVLTRAQLNEVQKAGAAFAVAPGCNPDIIRGAREIGLSFVPGIMTPSDVEMAVANGCTVLKFYHAGIGGGPAAIRSLFGPYAHLGLRYIPLGGVNKQDLGEWLAQPAVLAVGGSWIAPPGTIAEKKWSEITDRARAATEVGT